MGEANFYYFTCLNILLTISKMSHLINGGLLRMTPEWCRTMMKRLPSPLLSSSITSSPFTNNCSVTPVRLNCHRASITRIHRAIYTKPYKSLLCLQDGSTVTVRTNEPIRIMVISEDLKTMSAEDKEARFRKRKRQDDVVVTDEFEDDFDYGDYVS